MSGRSVEPTRSAWRRGGAAAGGFFTGWGLPVFLGAATVIYELFLLAVLLAPNRGAWGLFAEDFKIWCFSYDPRTGGVEWMAVAVMLTEPLFICGVLVGIWRLGRHRSMPAPQGGWPYRAAAAGVVCGALAVSGLYALGRPVADVPGLPFPGERIRTRLTPPEFNLQDQRGAALSDGDLKGEVTLVTGIYAECTTACPQIMLQMRETLDALPPDVRARLRIWAFSLNPEYDTRDLMSRMAEGYGFDYPQFRYLNGAPVPMRRILENWQFSARRDPATGIIEHANLYILVDAQGRIAYRFNTDPRHEGWLREAITALATEAPSP